MSLWLGLKNAKVSERGEFLGEGSYDVKITRLISKISEQSKQPLFIAEFQVLTSTNPAKDPPMSDRVWIVTMTNQSAPGNVKGFIIATMGKDHAKDAVWVNQCLDPVIETNMDHWVGSPSNPLGGFYVHVDTNIGQTKGKNNKPIHDFTYHNWAPFDYAAAGMVPPDISHLLVPMGPAMYGAPQEYGAPPAYGRPAYPAPAYAPPPVAYQPPPQPMISADGFYQWNGVSWVPRG